MSNQSASEKSYKKSWQFLALSVEYTGTETPVTSPSAGTVLTALKPGGVPVYRFIATALDANGYPIQDSFYSTFSGGTLSNLISTRYA
jgi:hypothetical protein